MTLNDNITAASQIGHIEGMQSLTGKMKEILVDGVTSVSDLICMLAFEYYKTNDFEPTPEIIPIMREVVTTALAKGAI